MSLDSENVAGEMSTSSNVPSKPSGPAACTAPTPASVPVKSIGLPSDAVPVTTTWGKIGAGGGGTKIKGSLKGVMVRLSIARGGS